MKINYSISFWAAISTYTIANGLLYSWAFWSTFKVNILQYVSIYDLLASIIYLVASPFAMFVCYSIIVRVGFTPSLAPSPAPASTKAEGVLKNQRALKLKYYFNAACNMLVIAAYYAMSISTYIDSVGYKKIIISFLMFLPAMMILINSTSTILKDKIPFNNVILSILIAAPFYLFLNAKSQADDIINGRDTFIIYSDSNCLSKSKYRYISTVGDKAFAISLNDNSLCVFKYNYIKLIEEKNHTPQTLLPADRA